MIETHHLPANACLRCGALLDAATNAQLGNDSQPHEGAISICRECGHLMAFTADSRFRELTDEERAKVENHPDVQRALVALAEWNGLRKWSALKDRLTDTLRKRGA